LVKKIYENYTRDFPQGSHAALCRQRVGELQKILAQNEGNSDIVFRKDSGKVKSVEQLLAPYKGRYVYLDIWGSWCGPCRDEMKFSEALKEHFSGRNIVFLYLDMDENRQDERWKSFVRLENITGQHLRMDGNALEKIWNVLTPGGDGSRFYPSYFIFDRAGKVIPVQARRPSEKEDLYRQLEEITNK
jgi:thiol-disulfide isomerase/thioredoxin